MSNQSKKSRDELLGELVEAGRGYQTAVDLMDDAASRHLGLNRTDMRCVDILDRRGPMPAGQLAKESGLTPGAATTAIDRLERAGFARRVRDESDRRRVMVEITPLARERAWEIYGPLGTEGYPRLADFTVRDLEKVIEYLRLGAELNERRAAELREEAD